MMLVVYGIKNSSPKWSFWSSFKVSILWQEKSAITGPSGLDTSKSSSIRAQISPQSCQWASAAQEQELHLNDMSTPTYNATNLPVIDSSGVVSSLTVATALLPQQIGKIAPDGARGARAPGSNST